MFMIIIEVACHKVTNTLIDGGSGVNIILDFLWIWLRLQGMQPSPFQVKMANQQCVQPMGLFKDFPIQIFGLEFLSIATVLRMEGFNNKYSILLGRPWLWQTKVHHDWRIDLLSLSITSRTVAIFTHTIYLIQPCHQPLALQMYDWMVGLTNEEED